MTEQQFWTELEYRLCRELALRPENHLRFLSCDGFIPDDHQPHDDAITGYARIYGGEAPNQYRFCLWLPFRRSAGMNWQVLLPPTSSHDWFTIDRLGKRLVIGQPPNPLV